MHCWHWHNPNGPWQKGMHVICCPCKGCDCGAVKSLLPNEGLS